MKLLVAKRFILPFDTGVIVIRHWKIHNYIRKDMYHPTECQAERGLLTGGADKTAYAPKEGVQIQGRNVIVTDSLQDCNGIVTDSSQERNGHVTDSSRSCAEPVSIGKVRLGKVNISSSSSTRVRVRARARRTRILTENSDMSSRSMPTMSIQPMGLSSPTNCYPSTTSTTASGWRRPLSRQPSRRQDRT